MRPLQEDSEVSRAIRLLVSEFGRGANIHESRGRLFRSLRQVRILGSETWFTDQRPAGSAGFRQGGAEMFRQVLCDLPRDALYHHEVLQARLYEVLRALESGVDQGLRPRLPDPLNPHEVLEDVRLGRLRGLELEDPPLDALVPRAPLERLRVRPQGVVVPAHLHEHIALRRPRLLVVRIELREMVERVERVLEVALREQDVPAVQEGRGVVRLDAED